jgi:uncharacterized protein (TIGR00730 family)
VSPTGPPAVERSIWFREDFEIEKDLEFITKEFRAGFELVEKIDRPAVSVFGSARTAPDQQWAQLAYDTAEEFAREHFAVITGGGPGIMEAANKGCREAGGLSIGLGIVLPHEQKINDFCNLSYVFKHFYARKVCFVKAAEGFVVFPGGFGTNDELFEALLLIQTTKIKHFPVVLFGEEHWRPMVRWLSDTLLEEGQIVPDDLELFEITDSPQAAVRAVVDCYHRVCTHDHSEDEDA